MFKEIKSQAKKLLRKNYKTFLPLILLYELFVILDSVAFSVLFEKSLPEQRYFLIIVCFFAILLVELVLLPIITVSVYKVGLCILKNANDITFKIKQFLTKSNIFKIAIINLIPKILVLASATIKESSELFNNKTIYFILTFFVLFIRYIVSYTITSPLMNHR